MPAVGSTVTFKNGAQAKVVKAGAQGKARKFRFTKGASNVALSKARQARRGGPNKRPSSRPVGDAYLLKKLKADKGYNARAVHSDMSRRTKKRSLNRNDPHDARIIRKAGSLNRWDVKGFDDGSKGKGRAAHPVMRMRPGAVRVYPTRGVQAGGACHQRAGGNNDNDRTARAAAFKKFARQYVEPPMAPRAPRGPAKPLGSFGPAKPKAQNAGSRRGRK